MLPFIFLQLEGSCAETILFVWWRDSDLQIPISPIYNLWMITLYYFLLLCSFFVFLVGPFLGNVNIPCWQVLEVLPSHTLKGFALSTIWTFHSEYSFLGGMKKYSLISGVQNSLCYFCEDLLCIWYCANISLFVHKALMNKHLHICVEIANPHLTIELMAFSLKPNHFECCQASLHFVHQTRELLT